MAAGRGHGGGRAQGATQAAAAGLDHHRHRKRETSHPLVEKARTYIEENYHQRIFLSSVAAKLHISPNYLSRLFRRETGVTLTSYIQQRRMEHAMLLLGEGGRSISLNIVAKNLSPDEAREQLDAACGN